MLILRSSLLPVFLHSSSSFFILHMYLFFILHSLFFVLHSLFFINPAKHPQPLFQQNSWLAGITITIPTSTPTPTSIYTPSFHLSPLTFSIFHPLPSSTNQPITMPNPLLSDAHARCSNAPRPSSAPKAAWRGVPDSNSGDSYASRGWIISAGPYRRRRTQMAGAMAGNWEFEQTWMGKEVGRFFSGGEFFFFSFLLFLFFFLHSNCPYRNLQHHM